MCVFCWKDEGHQPRVRDIIIHPYSHSVQSPASVVFVHFSVGKGNDCVDEYGHSESAGAKVMGIAGRMARERERMIGMTDAERAWRAKWVKDQVLHGEPIVPKDYYRERYNPIRRFYRAPMEKLEAALTPMIGSMKAQVTRHFISKMGFLIISIYSGYYYMKYNRGDWQRRGGWKLTENRGATYPGDPGFPYIKDRKPNEYATFGFENSPI